MLGPFATASCLTPIHQMSLAVLSRAAWASMSTTTRDRGDRYGPMEWAQLTHIIAACNSHKHHAIPKTIPELKDVLQRIWTASLQKFID